MWFDDLMEKEFRRLSNGFFESDVFSDWGKDRSEYVIHRITITTNLHNPDGNSKRDHFPNRQSCVETPFVERVLYKHKNELKFVVEMPGVDKKDIDINIEEDMVRIQAHNKNKHYDAKIPLKYKIDANSAKAKYRNGILEITFKLITPKKSIVVE